MNPEKDKKKQKELLRRAIFISALMLYCGLWLGAEWTYRNSEIGAVMSHIVEDFIAMRPVGTIRLPGFLCLFPSSIGWVLIGAGVAFFLILSDYLSYVINKNTRPGEEHGSARFNTDYGKLFHDCVMSVKILRQGKEAALFQKIIREGKEKEDAKILFTGMDGIEE